MRAENLSFSAENAFCAVNIALRFAFASLCLDRAWNLTKFGMAMAARMPMMATTIISSIRVKPFIILFIRAPLGVRCGGSATTAPTGATAVPAQVLEFTRHDCAPLTDLVSPATFSVAKGGEERSTPSSRGFPFVAADGAGE